MINYEKGDILQLARHASGCKQVVVVDITQKGTLLTVNLSTNPYKDVKRYICPYDLIECKIGTYNIDGPLMDDTPTGEIETDESSPVAWAFLMTL